MAIGVGGMKAKRKTKEFIKSILIEVRSISCSLSSSRGNKWEWRVNFPRIILCYEVLRKHKMSSINFKLFFSTLQSSIEFYFYSFGSHCTASYVSFHWEIESEIFSENFYADCSRYIFVADAVVRSQTKRNNSETQSIENWRGFDHVLVHHTMPCCVLQQHNNTQNFALAICFYIAIELKASATCTMCLCIVHYAPTQLIAYVVVYNSIKFARLFIASVSPHLRLYSWFSVQNSQRNHI